MQLNCVCFGWSVGQEVTKKATTMVTFKNELMQMQAALQAADIQIQITCLLCLGRCNITHSHFIYWQFNCVPPTAYCLDKSYSNTLNLGAWPQIYDTRAQRHNLKSCKLIFLSNGEKKTPSAYIYICKWMPKKQWIKTSIEVKLFIFLRIFFCP